MLDSVFRFLCRTATQFWLRHSRYSWQRLPIPNDSPHVHSPGSHPDRILVAGDGVASGLGVVTHELGLAGCLARAVSLSTRRATDIDLIVRADMTAESCRAALATVNLSRFDVILLTLGSNEALQFLSPLEWSIQLELLLDGIALRSPAGTKTVCMSVPHFGTRSELPRILQFFAHRQAARIDRASIAVIAARPKAIYLDFFAGDGLESDGADTYERWAALIAPAVINRLHAGRDAERRDETVDETLRQRSLDALGLLGMPADSVLDDIAATAKELFGTPVAGITFIDTDRQSMVSALGTAGADIPRSDAFCNITIQHTGHFVIEDTLVDAAYASNPVVRDPPHIRFYAGYPIETPDGYRVGSLCIMDTQPRSFSARDAALLRDLTLSAQERIWALSGDEPVPSR